MLTRAYSLLHVKAVDAATRTITGTATTPAVDRMGDIVEPLGAVFTLPLPLLWQHDAGAPIGHVTAARVTKYGIDMTAVVAQTATPGPLQARLDEAWESLRLGLVTGLSIGFKGIEHAVMADGGWRFLKWTWLELSAVTIPANADATIATVAKAYQAGAAVGARGSIMAPRGRGVGYGVGTVEPSMKTYADQIVDLQRSRVPKATRMAALMDAAGAEGRTLNDDEATEYDALAAEVKQYDTHVTRLEALEAGPAAAAVVVSGGGARAAAAVEVKSTLPPGIEFARYAICLAAARGQLSGALEVAKARYPDQRRIQAVLKGAIAGGTTFDDVWAGPLVQAQTLTSEFVEYLRPMTIVGKFGQGGIPALRRVPFNVRIAGQTSGGAGYWVGEGKSKPLTKFDFTASTLYWAKVAAISVISDELVRFSSPAAEGLVRDGLVGALTARLDLDFVDPNKPAVSGVSPASIVNGLAPLTSAGTDAAAVRADVKQAFEAFIAANISPTTGVWIMPQTVALGLSLMLNPLGQAEFPGITMTGGVFFGLPVITSQYATFGSPAGNIVILANAGDIYLSDDGGFSLDASREASLEMASDPTNTIGTGSPATPAESTLVSMYQTNSVALRAERMINWARRRDEAVQWISDVQWGAGSPL